jgi:hypothetical protein
MPLRNFGLSLSRRGALLFLTGSGFRRLSWSSAAPPGSSWRIRRSRLARARPRLQQTAGATCWRRRKRHGTRDGARGAGAKIAGVDVDAAGLGRRGKKRGTLLRDGRFFSNAKGQKSKALILLSRGGSGSPSLGTRDRARRISPPQCDALAASSGPGEPGANSRSPTDWHWPLGRPRGLRVAAPRERLLPDCASLSGDRRPFENPRVTRSAAVITFSSGRPLQRFARFTLSTDQIAW